MMAECVRCRKQIHLGAPLICGECRAEILAEVPLAHIEVIDPRELIKGADMYDILAGLRPVPKAPFAAADRVRKLPRPLPRDERVGEGDVGVE